MSRFVFFDHVYEDAWAQHRPASMDEWFAHCFGTSNFWECELREAGHEAKTPVLNWYEDHPTLRAWPALLQEARDFAPTHVVAMECARFPSAHLRAAFPGARVVCFCSHRASETDLSGWDVVFSSFPWMPKWAATFGQRCEYLPLAFGRQVLDRVKYDGPRDIPVAFIGGLGDRIWKRGTEIMGKIAEALPEFVWYGYQAGAVPESLARVHKPAAYGAEMYRLLMRTQICLNRHGEIAGRDGEMFGNNCRQYEATGASAFLITDHRGELTKAEAIGEWPEDILPDALPFFIRDLLRYPDITARSAKAMHDETMQSHTYRERLPRFLDMVENLP